MNTIELRQGDCLELIKQVPNESVDCILTDPPYLYLKHKLDRPFDEDALFAEFWRVVKPKGFVLIFGRGLSLARWVCKLDALGFQFKEEIVWDKRRSTSPCGTITRKHELLYIFSKGGGASLNKSYITFEEASVGLSIEQVQERLRRPLSSIRGTKEIDSIKQYLEEGVVCMSAYQKKFQLTHTLKHMTSNGASLLRNIYEGYREASIISVAKEALTNIHPTQKPVRLLERLLALTTKEGAMVLDPFAGSGSTLVACQRTGRSALGFEIDAEYYQVAQEHIKQLR